MNDRKHDSEDLAAPSGEDQGCDSDGAWSAWQGCWELWASKLRANAAEPAHPRNARNAEGTCASNGSNEQEGVWIPTKGECDSA